MLPPILKKIKVKIDKNIFMVEVISILTIILLAFCLGIYNGVREEKLLQEMSVDYSCGKTDISLFCKEYNTNIYELQDSIVLKRNLTKFLELAELPSKRFVTKGKK